MNHYETVAKALAYIRNHVQQQPALEEVAAHVHMSPFHFQRLFTEWAGVSPKKFLQYLTLNHAKAVLARNSSLADAAFHTGLSGASRLHDLFLSLEGMTPGEFKKQGEQLQLNYSFGSCVFGNYLVASTDRGICHLHFYEEAAAALQEVQQSWPKATLALAPDELHAQVADFLHNRLKPDAPKLKLHLQIGRAHV